MDGLSLFKDVFRENMTTVTVAFLFVLYSEKNLHADKYLALFVEPNYLQGMCYIS